MALSVETATAETLRHVVAQSRGRRPLFADFARRSAAARQLADSCNRHRLKCLVWCITDRRLHVVLRGTPASITLATHELIGSRLRYGHWLSTIVNPRRLPARGRAPRAARPGARRPVPSCRRMAILERARIAGPAPAPSVDGPCVALRPAGPARRQRCRAPAPLHGRRIAADRAASRSAGSCVRAACAFAERPAPGARTGAPCKQSHHVARDGAQRRAGTHLALRIGSHALHDRCRLRRLESSAVDGAMQRRQQVRIVVGLAPQHHAVHLRRVAPSPAARCAARH